MGRIILPGRMGRIILPGRMGRIILPGKWGESFVVPGKHRSIYIKGVPEKVSICEFNIFVFFVLSFLGIKS